MEVIVCYNGIINSGGVTMKESCEDQVGNLSMENIHEVMPKICNGQIVDVELRTAKDGRIWININGISFIRFMPMARR